MTKPKFYVVWKGRKPGIYSSWGDCSAQVNGYPDAEYKSFETQALAILAYRGKYEDYAGKHISNLNTKTLLKIGKPIRESYSVDASCIGNPGLMEFRCVHTSTKKELFRHGPYQKGTNNIGEFLAIVHILVLSKKFDWNYPIYTDSEIAMQWVKDKACKTRLLRDETTQSVFELISKAEGWLKENALKIRILKWNTEAWGEIPADFGRK